MINIINTGAGTDTNTLFIVNNQLEVAAAYHTPLSVGFGFGYKIGKHRIHFSAEWFDVIQKYNVLETEDFIGQSDGKSYTNSVNTEAKSVINNGIGGEFYLKEKLTLYLSFVTDFSASIPDSKTNSRT